MKKTILSLITVVAFITMAQFTAQAQNCPPSAGEYLGCNPNGVADPSAIITLDASNKGFLVPRMTETQKMAIASPATGLLVFQTDATSGFYYYNGTAWMTIGGQDSDWTTSGNDLYSGVTGNVGIGTTTPNSKLDVVGGSGVRTRVFSQSNSFAGNLYKNNTREFFVGVQGVSETNNTTSGFQVFDNTASERRLVIDENGNMGVNQSSPTARLDVVGTFKLLDGTQGVGKVLTSDANGNASWQTASGGGSNQDLSLSGTTLSLTGDPTTVDLSSFMDNTDAQDLSLSGTTLSLTGDATTVDLSSLSGWGLTGNAGTTAGTNFIGTTDAQNLDFRTNNIVRTRITQKGQIEVLNTGNSVFLGQGAGANDDLNNRQNVFIGSFTGTNNTTGAFNVFVGREAGAANTTGMNNTAHGFGALRLNTTGTDNVAVGGVAMFSTTTGLRNTAIGKESLNANTTGNDNVAVGRQAGAINTVGSNNTFLGHLSNATANNFSNATVVGALANVNASNKVRIGNTSVTVAEVQVAWTVTSDKNAKENIQYDVAGLDFINQLEPATYKYKTHDEAAPRYTGLLAQDVEATLQKMGMESSIVTKPNEDGSGSWGIRYAELTMPLINAVKELSEENKALKAKVNEIEDLKAELSQIKALLSQQASK